MNRQVGGLDGLVERGGDEQPVEPRRRSRIGVEDAVSRGWTFEIPANCPAQWLELSGRSGDIAQPSEATITALALEQAGAHG